MKPLICGSVFMLGMAASVALADNPLYLFDKLPVPLKLPPNLTQTLKLNPKGSFFGDQMRIVDCSPAVPPAFPGDTPESEVRFGTCGHQYFGGVLMTESHLTGSITIKFTPVTETIAHFVVTLGVLKGEDGALVGPLGFNFPLKGNQVSDAITLSSGDLDLTTGYADPNTLKFYSYFSNSGLAAIGKANPKLPVPVIAFPGIRGLSWASFAQRPDGLLDFYYRGSTFLALGNDIG